MKPDHYDTIEEAARHDDVRVNTNRRYRNFNQTHFTAGDREQFLTAVGPRSRAVINTFNYMFYKFKKGIFISIRNGRVDVFLPFSNVYYRNEWHARVDMPPGVKCERDKSRWVANNNLIRYEPNYFEYDSGICTLKNMFETLCDVRDVDFFVNKRDFPLRKHDGTEAYDAFFGDAFPLVSHSYDEWAPILSQTSNDAFSDLLIPTFDDWIRACPNQYFPHARYDNEFTAIPYDDKIATAIFRGSSTGAGVTTHTNMRLKVAEMAKWAPVDNGIPFLDAGITRFNTRYRKIPGSRMLQTIRPDNTLLRPFMPYREQARYKYILVIDGHCSSFRLCTLLGIGSLLLVVESPYRIWIHKYLKPGVHYIQVRADLANLFDQIKWCREHDKECKQIAAAALSVYETVCSRDGILDELADVLGKMN